MQTFTATIASRTDDGRTHNVWHIRQAIVGAFELLDWADLFTVAVGKGIDTAAPEEPSEEVVVVQGFADDIVAAERLIESLAARFDQRGYGWFSSEGAGDSYKLVVETVES